MNFNQQSGSSCSFTSPVNEDVKPNIQLVQSDVFTRYSTLQDYCDVKPTPPDFSQSCNHKILVSKSFDCKTGMTQADYQPNVTNCLNSTSIKTERSSKHPLNHYNTCKSNDINTAANYFESCEREHAPVSEAPLYQNSFSQNLQRRVIQEPPVLRSFQNYPSTSSQNLNHQSESRTRDFSENFVHSWQQSSGNQLFILPQQSHSPTLRVPHKAETSYNSPMVLPPLHLPPPSFPSGSSTTKIPLRAQNSLNSNSSLINIKSKNFARNRSRSEYPPLNILPHSFPSSNSSSTNIPRCTQNSIDSISTSESAIIEYSYIPQNRSNSEYAPFDMTSSNILHFPRNSLDSISTSETSKSTPQNKSNRKYALGGNMGNPSSSNSQFYDQNSLDSKSLLKSTINGFRKSVPYIGSNTVHSPLNVPPPNFFPNNLSTSDVSLPMQALKSPGPCYSSNVQLPFDVSVPPPSFSLPPPRPSNLYPSCSISSLSQIKSEIPPNDNIRKPSCNETADYNTHVQNEIDHSQFCSSNLSLTLKSPRSPTRPDCDYYGINEVSGTSNSKVGEIRFATNIFNNISSSCESYTKPNRLRSKERQSDNRTRISTNNRTIHSSRRTRRSSSRTRRSSSRTRDYSSRSRRSSSRTRRSSSRTRRSSSRTKTSSRIKRSSSRNRRSASRTRRSSSRTRHSSSKTAQSSSRTRHSSKRYRGRSRSKQSPGPSESKRKCTRYSRSTSCDKESSLSEIKSSSSRSGHINNKSKTYSYRSEHNLKQSKRSRSKSVPKPVYSSSHSKTRSNSKTKCTSTVAEDNLSGLDKWRMNNCCSEREMAEKFSTLATMEADQIIEEEKKIWTRSAPADLYYVKSTEDNSYKCTQKTQTVCSQFKSVIQTFVSAKELKKPFDYTENRRKIRRKCLLCQTNADNSSDSEGSDKSNEEEDAEEENWLLELQLKQNHPDRLHPELWFNDKGEMNDGPVCRCSTKSRRSGIRHNIYAGEEKQEYCNPDTNNVDKLYHYRVTVSPPTNFLINKPTVIDHDNQEFIFEGFSLFSHHPLEKLPTCKVIRFNIQYTIVYIEEKVPEGFSVGETELFFNYLFHEVLELVDLDLKSANNKDGCPQFHIMPRFVRELKDNGKELLPMYRVLEFFSSSFVPVISEELAKSKDDLSTYDWQDFADGVKGMIIVKPGAKPCAMRVDQLDRESESKDIYPDAVHFGSRPLQLCFAGSPDFQKLWKSYVKLRHLVANKPKRTDEDKRRLASKEQKLQEMRTNSKMKRGVTVAISCRDFYRTGIMCDMVQHAMLIPVLICHLRFHHSLNVLEERIKYKFTNRYLLQLALTHPSYRENFGTNPDHARNSLSNCGVRQPEYGDRRIHFQNTRKRGINTLINIMSKLGRKVATESNITHNERLEFLGDAVVEFITSIHLFHVFPEIEEGGLATYRAAIVQNQHLAHLAKKLGLEEFMLYAHGSDLCHEVELKHAMANCFEALMGALFLDGGIHVADHVFSRVLYQEDEEKFNQWMNYPKHPLQEQEPDGDRQWVEHSPLLKKLQYLEYSSGTIFYHIRLLARVFTTRSMGYTNLTLGSNQRLEFLGDTVLQLITSDYLYNHFPEHHEGHLSLLRSSLVNNRTQSVVCNDIAMPFFANMINPKIDLKMKDRADLLEALLGAMYIDKGMEACVQFCKVCFFPRLQYFILNQEWNDPKSKLQQCCLTLRTLDGGEPDIPIYKVIEHVGPTNSRSYTVAVYFKHERLAKATGNSIQQAEMNAAKVALEECPNICPQLDHQKRVIAKSLELQKHEGVVVDVIPS